MAAANEGLIANGDFSAGMDHWSVFTEGSGRDSGSVACEVLHVRVAADSEDDWDVRANYVSGFRFREGRRCGLFFDA